MKRKIYFIISSIVAIVTSILCIVFSHKLIDKSLESVESVYKYFPNDFQERVTNLLQNSGPTFITITSILTIIFSLIILFNSIKNNIESKKTTFIILSIVQYLLSNVVFIQLLFFVSIIVSVTIKGIPKEKKEMPKLEYESSKKDIIKSLFILGVYFSQLIWDRFVPSGLVGIIIIISFYVLMLVLSITLFFKEIKSQFIIFKNNFSAYLKFIIPRYLIGMAIFIVVNLISILLTKKATSINQSVLESMPKWYILPLAIIWAPIVEETVFRVCIRKIINHKVVFIITSALIFGLMHAVNETSIYNIVISSLPYSVFGAILAYVYTKSNNLMTNVSIHFFQNTLSSILMLFI